MTDRAAAAVIEAEAAAITGRTVIPLPPARPLPDILYIVARRQQPDPIWLPSAQPDTKARPGYRPVTYIHVPHPRHT